MVKKAGKKLKSSKITPKKIIVAPKKSLLIRLKLLPRGKKMRYSVYMVIALAILTYLGIGLVQKIVLEKNKRDLMSLQKDIIAELGQPIEQNFESSCGYSNSVYRKGSRSCGSSVNLIYKVIDATDFIKKQEDILPILDTQKYIDTRGSAIEESDVIDSAVTQNLGSNKKEGILSCHSSYIFSSSRLEISKVTDMNSSDKYMHLRVSCSTGSLFQYFPEKK